MTVQEITRQDIDELSDLALQEGESLDELSELLDIDYFNDDLVNLADLDGYFFGDRDAS